MTTGPGGLNSGMRLDHAAGAAVLARRAPRGSAERTAYVRLTGRLLAEAGRLREREQVGLLRRLAGATFGGEQLP